VSLKFELHVTLRRSLSIAIAIASLAECHSTGVSPGLEPQTEDYTTARSHFQTRLVRNGPAPQRSAPMHAPTGASQVEYTSNPRCNAWITRPDGGPKRPAVLFLHGGFAIGDDDWAMTAPYRSAGFVVMAPALRGENGQDGSYSMFYDEVQDVLAAADYLSKQPNVDSTHMYLAGHSVGGTMTLLSAMTTDRFRAAASFSGSPDQVAWSKDQPQLIPFNPANPREFQMRSPVSFATSFKCPVRIFCGSQEPYFAGSSKRTADLAKTKGLDVDAVAVPGDHFSAVPEEIRQSIEFFHTK
jgi:dipeptidyl aminopeptidase/acylaminoacyl peptidase